MNPDDYKASIFNYGPQPVKLPNATAVLVLGILSLVLSVCYGVPGLTCGIIALVLSARDRQRHRTAPFMYDKGSYESLKAGRICAIIGVCLSAPFVLLLLIYLTVAGHFLSTIFMRH